MPAFKKINKQRAEAKLTPEFIEKVTNYLRLGCYIETAVVMAGTSKQTFYTWIKKGHQEEKGIYRDLLDAVERGQEECTARDLLVIDKCANGQEAEFLRDDDGEIVRNQRGFPILKRPHMEPDWNAAAWRLERRKPGQWSRTNKLELSGPDGSPIQTSQETEEERIERLQRIAEYQKKLSTLDETG